MNKSNLTPDHIEYFAPIHEALWDFIANSIHEARKTAKPGCTEEQIAGIAFCHVSKYLIFPAELMTGEDQNHAMPEAIFALAKSKGDAAGAIVNACIFGRLQETRVFQPMIDTLADMARELNNL